MDGVQEDPQQLDVKYTASERESSAVMFLVRKSRLYLLLSDFFTLFIDQQTLKAAFSRKDILERLVCWQKFWTEYDFKFQLRGERSHKVQTSF